MLPISLMRTYVSYAKHQCFVVCRHSDLKQITNFVQFLCFYVLENATTALHRSLILLEDQLHHHISGIILVSHTVAPQP